MSPESKKNRRFLSAISCTRYRKLTLSTTYLSQKYIFKFRDHVGQKGRTNVSMNIMSQMLHCRNGHEMVHEILKHTYDSSYIYTERKIN